MRLAIKSQNMKRDKCVCYLCNHIHVTHVRVLYLYVYIIPSKILAFSFRNDDNIEIVSEWMRI